MTQDASYWFSPAPSEITSSRLSLDFGLRAADLYFRELVVPGLGNIWFARQLSWPVAALALYEELKSRGVNAPKPTAICRGIEALACKLEYSGNQESQRILGRRAFARDTEGELWSFDDLRQATNYVRNTHRQAATRVLKTNGGLGFAKGPRFDRLELEPVGRALAAAFLERKVGRGKGRRLSDWLVDWLQGERKCIEDASRLHGTLRRALSPEFPAENECELIRGRLVETATAASDKRQRLALVLGESECLPNIEGGIVPRLRKEGHEQQAREIEAARAFGAVLDRARDVAASLSRLVERGHGARVGTVARDASVRHALAALRQAAESYIGKANVAGLRERSSREFAGNVPTDDEEAIRFLARRAGDLFVRTGELIARGLLFRVIDANDSLDESEQAPDRGGREAKPDDPLSTWRTFRIANLHSLIRDVGTEGAR